MTILKKLFLLLLLGSLLAGCAKADCKEGPWFERPLAEAPFSWRTIVPGKTTESQVRAILGEPSEIYDADYFYYQYDFEGMNNLHYHRIFFKKPLIGERVVSVLDIETGVDPSDPYTITSAMYDYGNVDTAVNRWYTDRNTSDLVYVWAFRGIALIAINPISLDFELPAETLKECRETLPYAQVPQTFIINDYHHNFNLTDTCDLVVRKVLFEPMGFWDFWDEYGYRISVLRRDPTYIYENNDSPIE